MAWVNVTDIMYPIGAYYISHDSTPPGTLFGGTWTSVTGRFLYCNAGTGTGGSNTHTLTVSELPSHNHDWRGINANQTGASGSYCLALFGSDWATDYINAGKGPQPTGGGGPHNNMPAYQTVYAWRRTA